MSNQTSVIVQEVYSASAAWRAGIRFGDIIESYGGVPTPTNEALERTRRSAEEQGIAEVKMQVYRPQTGENLELDVRVGPLGVQCGEKNSATGDDPPSLRMSNHHTGLGFLAFLAVLVGFSVPAGAILYMADQGMNDIQMMGYFTLVAGVLMGLVLATVGFILGLLTTIASRAQNIVTLLDRQARRMPLRQ